MDPLEPAFGPAIRQDVTPRMQTALDQPAACIHGVTSRRAAQRAVQRIPHPPSVCSVGSVAPFEDSFPPSPPCPPCFHSATMAPLLPVKDTPSCLISI